MTVIIKKRLNHANNTACYIYIGVRNEPPPIVDVIIDETSIENSVDFTSSTLTPDTVSWLRIITLVIIIDKSVQYIIAVQARSSATI